MNRLHAPIAFAVQRGFRAARIALALALAVLLAATQAARAQPPTDLPELAPYRDATNILGATPASGCPGVELGLDSPKQLGVSVTDASGVGTFMKKIPAVAQGKTMHVQAFLPDECVVTNVETTLFQ